MFSKPICKLSQSAWLQVELGKLSFLTAVPLRNWMDESEFGTTIQLSDIEWNHSVCSTGQLEVSHVIPIIFLSNTLGPSVLPKSVEQQDFESSLRNLSDVGKKNLITSWYTLDSQNQPPCYRLKATSTVSWTFQFKGLSCL